MTTLTIIALAADPLTVITQTLPTPCDPLLLKLAYLTAEYCCKSQYLLANAVRQEGYVPPAWKPKLGGCDAHEIHEAIGERAEEKLREILGRGGNELQKFIEQAHRKVDW